MLLQISSSANKSGKLSGQSTLSEEEDLPKATQGSSGEDSTFPIGSSSLITQPPRQPSKKDKYSKGRNPIQSLNPTQLQPPSSVVKAEEIPTTSTDCRKQLLQRTFRVDMNDPEQPLLGTGDGQELDTINAGEVAARNTTDSESPVPYGVIPRSSKAPAQVNSGWL